MPEIMGQIPEKALFRLDEVAAILAVSIHTVRRYLDDERLAYITLPGGHRRIPRWALMQILHQTMPNQSKPI